MVYLLRRVLLLPLVCVVGFWGFEVGADDGAPRLTQETSHTSSRDANENPLKLNTVILQDVHGLWGGQNVYIRVHAPSFVQVVTPDLEEKRYQIALSTGETDELQRLLALYDFMRIAIEERPGVPDEARPSITVKLVSGETRTVQKWMGDTHEGFDTVYEWLLVRVKAVATTEPIYRGTFNPEWRPEGF